METVEVHCAMRKEEDGKFVLYPRSQLDRNTISVFLDGQGRYVTVRLMNKAQLKTNDQNKAFWALMSVFFQSHVGTKPSSNELRWFYEELAPSLLPMRDGVLYPDKKFTKHWSELTKQEAVSVISKLMSLVIEKNNIPEEEVLECRDIFFWLQQTKGKMPYDPSDFHDDGTPLTMAEWAEKNKVCMVTGIQCGDVCHIVSRGEGKGFEWLVNQPWNLYRCHHGIHIDIQHGKPGWEGLFMGFDYDIGNGGGTNHWAAPWLRARHDRARRLFNRGRILYLQGLSKEEVIECLCKERNA